jgi:hypothetical protein
MHSIPTHNSIRALMAVVTRTRAFRPLQTLQESKNPEPGWVPFSLPVSNVDVLCAVRDGFVFHTTRHDEVR